METIDEAVSNMSNIPLNSDLEVISQAKKQLELMKAAQKQDINPSAELRIDRLQRLDQMLVDNQTELVKVMSEDFSHRGSFETELVDITMVLGEIRNNKRNLKRWMKPRREPIGKHFFPAQGKIVLQPKGVVGIMSPWNFPIFLSVGPLAGVLAAGNRAILKPSELAPLTAEYLQSLINDTFDSSEVCVVNGGPQVAAEFSTLPFDHLVFTGSTRVGRMVAEAAARNLTPVTLELGGKSPTIIGKGADLKYAAKRVAFGKTANAGQACVAPDYVMVPRENMKVFADLVAEQMKILYPDDTAGKDYTALVSEKHQLRIEEMLSEAENKGADIIGLKYKTKLPLDRQLTPSLVLDPKPGSRLMQEEIFGPVLPIIPYDSIDDAMAYVTNFPDPLALYIFTEDKKERDLWVKKTKSGAVAVNETCFQALAMPFGGVGHSGMGAYHGQRGFDTFSHRKSVMYQPKLNAVTLLYPPVTGFSRWVAKIVQRII